MRFRKQQIAKLSNDAAPPQFCRPNQAKRRSDILRQHLPELHKACFASFLELPCESRFARQMGDNRGLGYQPALG